MNSKRVSSDDHTRIYKAPEGAAYSCKLVQEDEAWYGWCGLVDDQSDYVIGPYSTTNKVFEVYERINPTFQRCKSVTLFKCKPPTFEVL